MKNPDMPWRASLTKICSILAAIVGALCILTTGCATGFRQPVMPWYRQDPLQGSQPSADVYDALGTEVVDPIGANGAANQNPSQITQTRFRLDPDLESRNTMGTTPIPVRTAAGNHLPYEANPAAISVGNANGFDQATR